MKNYFYIFLIFLAAQGQFSCTSQLKIETTRPAKVQVANDQWKVMVMNRFNPSLITYESEKEIAVISTGAYEALLGAVDAVFDDSTYLLVHTDSMGLPIRKPGDKLSPSQVRKIYDKHPHHLLLTLDHFDFFKMVETISDGYGPGYASQSYINLVAQSTWTLYDSTGAVMDSTLVMADEVYEPSLAIDGFMNFGPSLIRLAPTVHRLAWYSGYDYWMRLSPQPDSYVRPFYSRKNFKEAAAFMVDGDWESAITLLLPMAASGQRDRAKAAYNLAVIYEALSQFEEAKYWVLEAAEEKNRLAMLLLHELENY